MLVSILSDCRADGRHLASGEVVDISEEAARGLIAIGRAEHGTVSVEAVADAVTATAEELAQPVPDKPPAKRGRPPATPINQATED